MTEPTSSEIQVQFVSDLAGVLRDRPATGRRLFRGQSIDLPLLPKIVRVAEKKGIPPAQIGALERRMLERFKKESLPLFSGVRPQTDWEWLSVAQHQGMPTRLLDWTANALAGLWFTVADESARTTGDGVLWVLDVDPRNETQPTEKDVFTLKRTYVFQPFHLDRRIVAQAAWFSVHRYSDRLDTVIPLNINNRFKKSLRKLIVPRDQFGSLRWELRQMGVTQATMYPDLVGLCAEIHAEVLESWKRVSVK